jgi:hypothetical protein
MFNYANSSSTDVNDILFNIQLNPTDIYDLSTDTNISTESTDTYINSYNNNTLSPYESMNDLEINDRYINDLDNNENIYSLYGKANSQSPYSIYKSMDELKFLYEKNPTLIDSVGNNNDNLKDVFDEFIKYDTEDNTLQENTVLRNRSVKKSKTKKSKTVKKQ